MIISWDYAILYCAEKADENGHRDNLISNLLLVPVSAKIGCIQPNRMTELLLDWNILQGIIPHGFQYFSQLRSYRTRAGTGVHHLVQVKPRSCMKRIKKSAVSLYIA